MQRRECFNADGSPKEKLDQANARAFAKRVGTAAYRCGTCGHWHTGKAKGRRRSLAKPPPMPVDRLGRPTGRSRRRKPPKRNR